jgi:hypothetical protein
LQALAFAGYELPIAVGALAKMQSDLIATLVDATHKLADTRQFRFVLRIGAEFNEDTIGNHLTYVIAYLRVVHA